MVLDVANFPSYHPGGKFVISRNIGRDVSKFFYGGYILENYNRSKPHTHTNIGRITVNTFGVSYLNGPALTFKAEVIEK